MERLLWIGLTTAPVVTAEWFDMSGGLLLLDRKKEPCHTKEQPPSASVCYHPLLHSKPSFPIESPNAKTFARFLCWLLLFLLHLLRCHTTRHPDCFGRMRLWNGDKFLSGQTACALRIWESLTLKVGTQAEDNAVEGRARKVEGI